uniref:Uncharacterized protein n=1 Tax=Avena sativa TaxID=4498 RepID=A0ACD5X593_AVESA
MEASLSNSCSVKDMVNGSHNFMIQGYSLAKGMGAHCERDLHRGKIPMGDLLLPLREELRGQLRLPLHHARLKGTNACALSELTLQYHSSRGKHKAHSHVGRFLESEPYTLRYHGSVW